MSARPGVAPARHTIARPALSTHWMEKRACDPSIDFTSDKPDEIELAKESCNRCPVIQECLAYALARREKHGVWGGLSEGERAGLFLKWKTLQPKPDKPLATPTCRSCGTVFEALTYRSWYCETCRVDARRSSWNSYDARQKATTA